MEENVLKIKWKKNEYNIPLDKVLYIVMKKYNSEIHLCGGEVFQVRCLNTVILQALNDSFIEVRKGCMVPAMAIYRFRTKLELINGESISYSVGRKKELIALLYEKRRSIIDSFSAEGVPSTPEEYRMHYISYESLPFAFADIEMVFNSENQAVDWIFRYGNEALARLEKLPLEQLIDSKFSSLFPKMDKKRLLNYVCSAIYGENLESFDYNPEMDTTLKIISFPTFEGHCGCILFDVSQIRLTNGSRRSALEYYGILTKNKE